MKHTRALRIASTLIAIGGIALMCWLLALNAEQFRTLAQRCYGYGSVPSYPDKLPLPSVGRLALAALPWVLAACAVALWPWLAASLRTAVMGAWRLCREAMADTWALMPRWERWWSITAVIGCTVIRCYLAITDPPVFDEALNWLLFAEHGPLVSLTFYAAPNNHIGATMLSAIVGLLPVDPLLALRAPTVVAALFLQAGLYLLVRRLASPMAAVLASAFAMAAPVLLYHDHLGRGYVPVVLAFTMAFGAAARWLMARDERGLWLLGIACSAGTFVMPSFLYAGAGLFAALMIIDGGRRRVLSAALWSAFTIAVLYAPAVIVSGAGAFVDNPWVRPVGAAAVAEAWWPHFSRTFEGLLGAPHGFALAVLLLVAGLLLAPNRERPVAIMAVIVMGISLVIPFIHGVLPFERTWIHLIIPLAVALALVADRGLARFRFPQAAIPAAMALFAFQLKGTREVFPRIERDAFRVMEAMVLLQAEKPGRIRAWAQPLSTYSCFAWKRGLLPEGCDFAYSSTTEVEPGIVVIGRKSEFDPDRGDRMLFTYEGADAIWVRGPAIHEQP